MGILAAAKAASIAVGLSLLFNVHSHLLEGTYSTHSPETNASNLTSLLASGNNVGEALPSLSSGNLYLRIFGGLLALFQVCGVLLASLKPISTQEIHDPTSPHLVGCFEPLGTMISLKPLGSGRTRLIKELRESETFCSYLRDPPK